MSGYEAAPAPAEGATSVEHRAGRVFADLRVHAFAGDPPEAACGAGAPVRIIGLTFSSDAPGTDPCQMCVHVLAAAARRDLTDAG